MEKDHIDLDKPGFNIWCVWTPFGPYEISIPAGSKWLSITTDDSGPFPEYFVEFEPPGVEYWVKKRPDKDEYGHIL